MRERIYIGCSRQKEREGAGRMLEGEREPNEDPYSLAIEIFLMSEETRREREKEWERKGESMLE